MNPFPSYDQPDRVSLLIFNIYGEGNILELILFTCNTASHVELFSDSAHLTCKMNLLATYFYLIKVNSNTGNISIRDIKQRFERRGLETKVRIPKFRVKALIFSFTHGSLRIIHSITQSTKI